VGTLEQLAILASAASLLVYLGVVLASVRLRYKTQADAAKTFTVPGGWLIPTLASLAILWLLSNLSRKEMMGSAIAIVLLSLIYVVMRWYKQKQTQLPEAVRDI
jgi:amino acid transporter